MVACQAPLSMDLSRQGYRPESVSIRFSRGFSGARNWSWVSIVGEFFTVWAAREAQDSYVKANKNRRGFLKNSFKWEWSFFLANDCLPFLFLPLILKWHILSFSQDEEIRSCLWQDFTQPFLPITCGLICCCCWVNGLMQRQGIIAWAPDPGWVFSHLSFAAWWSGSIVKLCNLPMLPFT